MKKNIYQLILTGLCLCVCAVAHARQVTALSVERKLNQAILVQQAKVQVSLDWEKEVHVRDVMLRPARAHAGDTVIRTEQETTACQGVLLEGNMQVAIPAVCLRKPDFSLQKVHLVFANNHTADTTRASVSIRGEVGYIHLPSRAPQGLRGLAVLTVQPGQSLQETFGSEMTLTLHRFFTSFGIAFKNRVCHLGKTLQRSRLQPGEPVFFQGRLVALLKQVPVRYGTAGGKVSERSLALFHS